MTKGLLYSDELVEHIEDVKIAVVEGLRNSGQNLAKDDVGEIRNSVRRDVQNFFYKNVKRRPVVITMLQPSTRK